MCVQVWLPEFYLALPLDLPIGERSPKITGKCGYRFLEPQEYSFQSKEDLDTSWLVVKEEDNTVRALELPWLDNYTQSGRAQDSYEFDGACTWITLRKRRP